MIPSTLSDALKNPILNATFGGAPDYITFLIAGMLCYLIMSWAMFAGGPLVVDRTLGILNKLLAAPIPRSAITLSLVISSIIKGLTLSVILIVLALVLPRGLSSAQALGYSIS